MMELCIREAGYAYNTRLTRNLLNEAMKATHIQTKTKVIITALEELIRESKITELKKFKGKVDLDMTLTPCGAVNVRSGRFFRLDRIFQK